MRTTILAAVACMVIGSTAHAQVTEEQQRQACEPDVMRLCAEAIPDRPRIAQCLRANVQQISAACRAMLNGGRPAAPQ